MDLKYILKVSIIVFLILSVIAFINTIGIRFPCSNLDYLVSQDGITIKEITNKLCLIKLYKQ